MPAIVKAKANPEENPRWICALVTLLNVACPVVCVVLTQNRFFVPTRLHAEPAIADRSAVGMEISERVPKR